MAFEIKKSSTDGYIILLMGYARSLFRKFESYLRIVVGLDEDDIRLILKQNNPNFVTFELDPGNYTTEDLQKAAHLLGDHEGTLQIESDDIDKKTNFFQTRLGSPFGTLRLDEKSFFHNFYVSHHIGTLNLQTLFLLIVLVFILVIKI